MRQRRERETGNPLTQAEDPQRALHPEPDHQCAARERAKQSGDQPKALCDGADIRFTEADLQQEWSCHRHRNHDINLVQDDEGQDFQRAFPVEIFHERQHHGFSDALRRGAGRFRFGREQCGEDADGHRRRHQEIHGAPRQVIGEDQRQRSRHQQRDPISRDIQRGGGTDLICFRQVRPIGVHDDVLARAEKRDQDGDDGRGDRQCHRAGESHCDNGDDQRHLREQNPSEPASQKRRDIAIHQRRPEELQNVRQPHQREQSDDREIGAFRFHPGLERCACQCERDPGRKSQ